MIIIDTNVVSEVMKPAPDERVGAWLRRQPIEDVYVTAITTAELLYGLALMPDGRRKQSLARTIEVFFEDRIVNPVLAFEEYDALHYARVSANRRRLGRPVRELDGQIAAIAASYGFAVATRNVRDFDDCGIRVLNPWQHTA